MQMVVWYLFTGISLFIIGFIGIVASPHPLRKVLALNIMGSGVFLLLIAPADRLGGRAPDPVPHAMVLTGIVVAVSATALALALARKLSGPSGQHPPVRETGD